MKELKLEEGTYTARRDQDGNIVLRAVEPASPLAEGHNPAGLTEKQVGVADGWRLLAKDELCSKREPTADIQTESMVVGNQAISPCRGALPGCTYRTKRPVGHFRPAPVGFTAADIESVLVDLKIVERAVSFGHPHEVIEQMIRRYENLKNSCHENLKLSA